MLVFTTGHPIKGRIFTNLSYLNYRKHHAQGIKILLGDFNQSDICWKSCTVSCTTPRRFLAHVEDHFLIQWVKDSPVRGEALLGLFLTNRNELIGEVRISGSLSCTPDPGPSLT